MLKIIQLPVKQRSRALVLSPSDDHDSQIMGMRMGVKTLEATTVETGAMNEDCSGIVSRRGWWAAVSEVNLDIFGQGQGI